MKVLAGLSGLKSMMLGKYNLHFGCRTLSYRLEMGADIGRSPKSPGSR